MFSYSGYSGHRIGRGLPAYTLVETGSDHRLADPESLEIMVEACRMGEDEEDDEEFLDINERDWTGLCYTAVLAWVRARSRMHDSCPACF